MAALALAAFGLGLSPQHALQLANDGTAGVLFDPPAVAAHALPDLAYPALAHPAR